MPVRLIRFGGHDLKRVRLQTGVPPLGYPSSVSVTPAAAEAPDVPAQVFEKFLADLAAAGLPKAMIGRLRTTLIDERAFSDRALRAAVLAEEPLP